MATSLPEQQTFFTGKLTRELSSTESSSMYVSSNETLGITSFYCVVDPRNSKREIIEISNSSGSTTEYTWTIAERGLRVYGADTEVGNNKKRHGVNAEVIISDNHNFLKSLITAFNTHEDLTSAFHGVAGIDTYANIPAAASNSGKLFFATDTLVLYYSNGSTWTAQSAGSVADSTTSVKGIGKVSVAPASVSNPIFVGDNDPRLLTSGQVTDLTDGGETTLHSHALPPQFGGDGSDGDITGSLTITGSNNTYIVKQYDTFTPGSNTVTVTPTNCIVHIKVKGTCDLTGTTFDFTGKGGQGGAGGAGDTATTPGNLSGDAGSNASGSFTGPLFALSVATGGDGGDTSAGTNNGGTGGAISPSTWSSALTFAQATGVFPIAPGQGGGGGGGGFILYQSGTGTLISGDGGDGGNGGGCLILEIAGDVTFSSANVNCNGTNGANGADGTGTTTGQWSCGGGGGGGGGAGGCFVCLYGGTATGSPTVNVAAGSAGSGGSGTKSGSLSGTPSYRAGAGGGGGSGIAGAGANGTDVTSNTNTGTAGGASGGNGQQLVEQYTAL